MDNMNVPRWLTGGVLTTLGFIRSPLSWWNDLFVNLPIAYTVLIVVLVQAGFLAFPEAQLEEMLG